MSKCLSLFVMAGMLVFGAQGASWVVWPGQSLQAAITNAAAGDNITLKEGNYVEDITLTKGMDIRGEAGKELTTSVQGKWKIQNATAPVYLKGFKIGVSTNGDVTVVNSTDVRFDIVTAAPSSLAVTNTTFYMYRSSFSGNATFNGGNFTLQKSTVSGDLVSTNVDTKVLASTVTGNLSHNTTAKECTVFQSTVGEKLYVSANNYWIGYNTIRYADIRNGGGTCEIVGNLFAGRAASFVNGLTLANTSPNVRNNIVKDYRFYDHIPTGSPTSAGQFGNGIYVINGNPIMANNVVSNLIADVYIGDQWNGGPYNLDKSANGIFVASGNARIINCIIVGTAVAAKGTITASGYAVYAPSSVEVKNCNFYGTVSLFGGGCTTNACILSNPMFTGDYALQAGSPCIDTGAPEPEFNDLDNTRNNIGLWGGHSYDPAGRTTTKPVVMATEASPLYVKRGQNIMLKARGAVAAP